MRTFSLGLFFHKPSQQFRLKTVGIRAVLVDLRSSRIILFESLFFFAYTGLGTPARRAGGRRRGGGGGGVPPLQPRVPVAGCRKSPSQLSF